jgi:hypothetical protein
MSRAKWALAGGLTVGLAVAAVAEPLPKEECEKLKAEQADSERAGLRDIVQKGPAWGKINLGADKLKAVERYISVEEMLSFRCGLAKARLTLPFADEDHPPGSPEEQKEGAPPPAAKPKPKPKAPVAAKPAPKAVVPKVEPAPVKPSQPATSRPPAKPKPKVEDAYRPPQPPDPTIDPFALQKSK